MNGFPGSPRHGGGGVPPRSIALLIVTELWNEDQRVVWNVLNLMVCEFNR